MKVKCDYCHGEAKLVTGKVIYPHRPDLFGKMFWQCEKCDAYVGCHPRNQNSKDKRNGTVPLGRLANAELRAAKQKAHAAFDPMWKTGKVKRASAYKWLAEAMGISPDNCHIGMMDVDSCAAVVAICKGEQ